jgi:predicted butyrate kinase (DUF1464 family)
MDTRNLKQGIARLMLTVVLSCAAADIRAQPIYRIVDAEGRITYTDRTAANASLVAGTGGTTGTAGSAGTRLEMSVAYALANHVAIFSSLAAAVDASEAARSLRQAQLKQDEGARPLPGDSAQNNRYLHRQESLRFAVEQAQRRSNETRR